MFCPCGRRSGVIRGFNEHMQKCPAALPRSMPANVASIGSPERGCSDKGSYVAGHKITQSPDTGERLAITWAVAHVVFAMNFPKQHAVLGVIIFNDMCGFATIPC
jgi:hypothetical protein